MKFDYKIIIIGVLLLGMISMIVFWPSPETNFNQEEINKLHQENKELIEINKDLEKENAQKDTIIFNTKQDILVLQNEVGELDSLVKNINIKRNETRNNVNNLDNDDIISGISDYISRRKTKN